MRTDAVAGEDTKGGKHLEVVEKRVVTIFSAGKISPLTFP